LIDDMRAEWLELHRRIAAFDNEFTAYARSDADARRLATIPGIGVLKATALLAAIGDGVSHLPESCPFAGANNRLLAKRPQQDPPVRRDELPTGRGYRMTAREALRSYVRPVGVAVNTSTTTSGMAPPLFALNTLNGSVIGRCMQRHRHRQPLLMMP
jgi:hypothetical protein